MEPRTERPDAADDTAPPDGGARAPVGTEKADEGAGPPPVGLAQRAALREPLLFLNEATVEIGASLDPERTARALADAMVPGIADFAAVHLLEALFSPHQLDVELPDSVRALSAEIRRVVVAHDEDPMHWSGIAPEGRIQVPSPTSPVHLAMATNEPVAVPRVDADLARELAGTHHADAAPPTVLDRSLLAIPLYVRGRTLGAVTLLRRPDRPPFDEVDMLAARQLAAQASLGVDNAYLYRSQATIGDALQRSMLPTLPSRLSSVDIAHRYVSSSHTAQVGGDWFDAIPLPGSRVALVVGDVMGHGIRSAAAMGQFRTAVQTLAAMDLPPHQVLRHLDDLAQRLGPGYLATCVYAIYDPVARRCTFANAGHIPPALLRADGRTELLRPPTGAPIGVGGVAFEPLEVSVSDGDVLVLCTDGLVESRGQDIDTGLAALLDNLSEPGLPLDAQCETLLRALHAEDREDDVALLVARLRGVPSGNVAQWLLQPRVTTPARVRRLVRDTLTVWGLPDCVDVTELLATELVTNAVRHASRPIELRLLRTDTLLCEVTDDDQHRPVLRHAAETDEGGRGLQLVSRLAARWGTSGKTTGKVVWFELDLPSS
ncbi:SpoIIE family protein phosphatase [Actinorugispora endophytica]|uniref:protein-serine/threonine phosphatase n=1 Tax=Actinorugispora endophytica TaxID=1605990 RepID=A0A4R6UVG8_9ACTN|nr:SpoIIE family protein phosphatase [Actinorugispora endophytica]TDQ50256.1 serine phosphatase RsbU (regulator of sigma subunit) [Actinorugispora endophytica]